VIEHARQSQLRVLLLRVVLPVVLTLVVVGSDVLRQKQGALFATNTLLLSALSLLVIGGCGWWFARIDLARQQARAQSHEREAAQTAYIKRQEHLIAQVSAGRERLASLSRQLVEVQERERRHIACELHDEIGQTLTGLRIMLQLLDVSTPEAARQGLGEAQALVGDLLARVRDLSLNLRPTMLDDLGLLPALLWHFDRYQAQTGVVVAFRQTGLEGRFNATIETAVYRLIQEALTNVARHAGVAEVQVQVWCDAETIRVEVVDHGRGFDVAAQLQAHDSCGLLGMRERADLLGGRFALDSAPGQGTCLSAEFALDGRLERRRDRR
jgi:signal transduction histidine kinase